MTYLNNVKGWIACSGRAMAGIVLTAASLLPAPTPAVAAGQTDAPAIACTQSALNAALSLVQISGGGTITFGCSPDEQLLGAEIAISTTKLITAPVTINGGGFVTLKANPFVQFFSVAQGKRLALRNIKLINGTASGAQGGSVYLFRESALDLSNVTIRNSSAANGGAIYAESRSTTLETRVQITVANSTLTANTAGDFGGALYSGDGDLRMLSSTISANVAGGGSGGGIVGGLFGGSLLIENSTVTSNTAFSGGGISWSNGPITVRRSTLSKNTARGFAGSSGESADGGALETQGAVAIESSQVLSNSALRNGGGIVLFGNALTVTSTTIANNRAISGTGGGLYLTQVNATLTDTHIVSNAARLNSAGGLFGRTAPLTLSHSSVVSNEARDHGSGLYLEQRSPLMLWNSQILSNTSQFGSGAGVYLDTPLRLDIRNSLFQANSARQGGGLNVVSDSGTTNLTAGSIVDSRFFSNSATSDSGGGIRLGSENLQMTMTGNLLSYNKASYGGGILVRGVARIVTNTVTHNEANIGGGIYWDTGDAPLYVANSDISHNRAVVERLNVPHAAAIFVGDYPIEVHNSRFFSNTSAGKAGAIYSQGVITLAGSTFASNSAAIDGGAVSMWGADARVRNSTFTGNSAPLGGAIYFRDGQKASQILHSTFVDNAATTGASVAFSSSMVLQLKNSVLAHGAFGANCGVVTGTIGSLGGNLVDDTSCTGMTQPGDVTNQPAGLGPLANNGGLVAGVAGAPIFTHLPISGSLAVDTTTCDFGVQTDQRGIARPQDGDLSGTALCDKGAVERTFVPIPPVGGGGKRVFLPALRR